MCPRFTESGSGGYFLGCELGVNFDWDATWIIHDASIFLVGEVNAPMWVALLKSRDRTHGGSSS